MNDVTLNPDGPAIKRFIQRAVAQNVDTPVANAFDGTWPVELTYLEAQEVLQAVHKTEPDLRNIHGDEHKRIALRVISRQLHTHTKEQIQHSM